MTARDVDAAIARLAGRQHGVFSRWQARALGATRDVIRRRLASGAWVRAAQGVYRLAAIAPSWESDLKIATLAMAPGAVSHEAAAALHGLATFTPGVVVVVTVTHGLPRVSQLAVVHQSRDVPPGHLTLVSALPVTTIARTIVDLASVCRRGRLEHVVDDAVTRSLVTDDQISRCFEELAARGRPGIELMREILEERGPGYMPPASRLESLLLRVLKRGGLPRPVLQYPLPGWERGEARADAAYPDARLIIEADGRRYHTRKRDFAVDRERDNLATLAGWRVLRFTWDDLTRRPDWVCEATWQLLGLGPSDLHSPPCAATRSSTPTATSSSRPTSGRRGSRRSTRTGRHSW